MFPISASDMNASIVALTHFASREFDILRKLSNSLTTFVSGENLAFCNA